MQRLSARAALDQNEFKLIGPEEGAVVSARYLDDRGNFHLRRLQRGAEKRLGADKRLGARCSGDLNGRRWGAADKITPNSRCKRNDQRLEYPLPLRRVFSTVVPARATLGLQVAYRELSDRPSGCRLLCPRRIAANRTPSCLRRGVRLC